jgi:transposase
MAKPYSSDLRARVIEAIEEGATREEAAERHHVSLSSVGRFLRLKRDRGSVRAAKFGGYKPYALATHEELVRHLLAEQPDITLAELKAILAKQKVRVGQTSIFRFLRHLKLTFKKKPARRRAGPAGHRGRSQGFAKKATKA